VQTPPPATPATAPASASARVAPPATAASTPPPASSGYGGKRLAIKVIGNCAPDPDPLGVTTSDSYYPDCDQELLDGMRAKISTALASRGIPVNDNDPDAVLTVTLTLLMDDEGALGVLGVGETGYHAEAAYQLSDPHGQIVSSGTVKSADTNNIDDEIFDPVEVKLAQEIAAAVTAN
jgi:hypothetical protein